jgi:NAD(P)-dependent dehydrogenase (short-subunit alcohol dehydrogenase family)
MSGRVALVTGCSTGIGRATAQRLAGTGHTVYATARRVGDIDDLGADGCRLLALDVTDDASMVAAVEAIEAEHGAVGALVNNAGYSQGGPVEEVPLDDARRQFETNVFGLARLCQLVLPAMRERRDGRIVNLSSMGGRMTLPGGGWYHATKHAVEALSDALRFEVAPFGIGVTVIEPGVVVTKFGDTAVASAGDASDLAGPYDAMMAGVVAKTAGAYVKAKPGASITPEVVAKHIEKAITSRRPKTRDVIGAQAHQILAARALLPDKVWDRFLASQFPPPKPD